MILAFKLKKKRKVNHFGRDGLYGTLFMKEKAEAQMNECESDEAHKDENEMIKYELDEVYMNENEMIKCELNEEHMVEEKMIKCEFDEAHTDENEMATQIVQGKSITRTLVEKNLMKDKMTPLVGELIHPIWPNSESRDIREATSETEKGLQLMEGVSCITFDLDVIYKRWQVGMCLWYSVFFLFNLYGVPDSKVINLNNVYDFKKSVLEYVYYYCICLLCNVTSYLVGWSKIQTSY